VDTELHITTTGQLFSFRPSGESIEKRTAVFSAFRYGTGPDAVLVTYGIQGEGYFRGIVENFDSITDGVKVVMGYIWGRHVKIYQRMLRKKAKVEVLFMGYPYGEDGPLMAWIMVEPLR